MANTYELIVKTVDRSTKPLKNIERSLASLERRSKTVNTAIKAVGAAAAAVIATSALKNVIEVTSRFEDLKTTLNTVFGSATAGAAAFDQISTMATKTQFGVEDLANTFIKLQAAGITPTEKLLRTFTDTAAVTTDQLGTLQAMTDLVTRTTGGGLGLEELERLADRGIPVYRILGEQLNITRSEISDLGQTAEGAQKILDALFTGLDASFGGATERRLGNLSTLVSNLGIATTKAIAAFGEGLSPALKEIIEGLTSFIDTNEGVFIGLGRAVGEGLRSAASAVKSLADSLGLLNVGGLEIAIGNMLVGFGAMIDGMITGFATLGRNLAIITNAMIEAIQVLKGGVILDVGINTPEEQIAVFQDRLAELTKQMLESDSDSLPAGMAAEVRRLTSDIEKLQDPATQVYRRIAEDAGLADVANANLGERIRAIGEEMIKAGEAAATAASMAVEFPQYDDHILRMARANEIAAQTQAAATAAAQAQARAAEELLMAQQVIPASVADISNAYSTLISATSETVRQQQINEELVRRVNQAYRDGFISVDQYRVAMASLGTQVAVTATQLSGFEQFMKSTIETAQASAAQVGYATQAQAALKEELAAGRINIDTFAAAMERVNGILGVSTPAAASTAKETIATVASTYKEATDAIKEYELNSTNVAGAMGMLESDFANGKISLEQFKVGMEGMGASMDDISNRSIAMGLTMTEAFQSAGDSLARGLARGIMKGESIMDSFANFMSSIFEEILYQIIQQAFITPLISSMTAGLSQAFGAFAMSGAGGFGGGFSLLGLLGGFFGLPFANGGVVPGLPTQGDSIPVLATPGEVILNKQQQAEVLQGKSGEPIQVNFNISAIDTRSGTEFILSNKKQITSVIQQAYNQRGQSGPLG